MGQVLTFDPKLLIYGSRRMKRLLTHSVQLQYVKKNYNTNIFVDVI